MRAHFRLLALDFSDAVPEVGDEFGERGLLGFADVLHIEIADEADADADVVQVVAVDVAALILPVPAVADFDRAVPRRSAVADDEVIREAVHHVPHIAVVVLECGGVSLPRAAVVDDDVAPASARDGRAINVTPKSRCHALGGFGVGSRSTSATPTALSRTTRFGRGGGVTSGAGIGVWRGVGSGVGRTTGTGVARTGGFSPMGVACGFGFGPGVVGGV